MYVGNRLFGALVIRLKILKTKEMRDPPRQHPANFPNRIGANPRISQSSHTDE